jgi:hypothetical protein
MRLLLQATDGKVFTLSTMHLLIDYTRRSTGCGKASARQLLAV